MYGWFFRPGCWLNARRLRDFLYAPCSFCRWCMGVGHTVLLSILDMLLASPDESCLFSFSMASGAAPCVKKQSITDSSSQNTYSTGPYFQKVSAIWTSLLFFSSLMYTSRRLIFSSTKLTVTFPGAVPFQIFCLEDLLSFFVFSPWAVFSDLDAFARSFKTCNLKHKWKKKI